MISSQIDAPVVGNHLVHLLAGQLRKQILEKIEKVSADVEPQELIAHGVLPGSRKNFLNRPTNVRRGVDQRAVDVEQINWKMLQAG